MTRSEKKEILLRLEAGHSPEKIIADGNYDVSLEEVIELSKKKKFDLFEWLDTIATWFR